MTSGTDLPPTIPRYTKFVVTVDKDANSSLLIPPKYDAAGSVYNSHIQTPRVAKLRKAVVEEKFDKGIKGCFYGPLKSEIDIYTPIFKYNPESIDERLKRCPQENIWIKTRADIDKYLGGILDSLQAEQGANCRYNFFEPQTHPAIAVLLDNDCCIIDSHVRLHHSKKKFYTVKITGVSYDSM